MSVILASMALGILFGLGAQELGLILLIVLVLFGATRVPQLMKGLGQGVKEFKKAVDSDDEKENSDASNASDNSSSGE